MTDPYSDLPPIPPGDRFDPDDLTPEALAPTTTPEQSAAVTEAVETIVHTHVGHRGQHVVDAVVNDVWIHMWQAIGQATTNPEKFMADYQALNNKGDVTAHD
ncbi:Uncharacterised protein [Mycobacteroides abscessus subsp. abscessus]|uniref:hypothetical protein n=1 Tax=Mycobacteroides abscessus TaxID=36809 RepID=UPI000926530A|nr:hypothetical protein [Mycobacteroides abscessus]SIB35640.1 Uncharacterised protein [Mycobacteroides abscessus subsp. abscessus]SIG01721.1 Uncharacterised protein [Mycobacteroides abscessus subsp. abscessus]